MPSSLTKPRSERRGSEAGSFGSSTVLACPTLSISSRPIGDVVVPGIAAQVLERQNDEHDLTGRRSGGSQETLPGEHMRQTATLLGVSANPLAGWPMRESLRTCGRRYAGKWCGASGGCVRQALVESGGRFAAVGQGDSFLYRA